MMTVTSIQCDACEKPATVSYEQCTVKYAMDGNGDYLDHEIVEGHGDSELYCEEHDPEYQD